MVFLKLVKLFFDLGVRQFFGNLRVCRRSRSSSRNIAASRVANGVSDTGFVAKFSVPVAPVCIMRFKNWSGSVFQRLLESCIYIIYRNRNHRRVAASCWTIIRSIQPHRRELFHEANRDASDLHYRIPSLPVRSLVALLFFAPKNFVDKFHGLSNFGNDQKSGYWCFHLVFSNHVLFSSEAIKSAIWSIAAHSVCDFSCIASFPCKTLYPLDEGCIDASKLFHPQAA